MKVIRTGLAFFMGLVMVSVSGMVGLVSAVDTDGDGLQDPWEIAWGGACNLNPALADTNGNGINDGNEDCEADGLVNVQEQLWTTNPTLWDSDADGLGDNWEATLAAVGVTDFHPAMVDADADGVLDQNEDPDSDDLLALGEQAAGTSTLYWDSDYDGCLDLTDAAPLVNPGVAAGDVDGDGLPGGPIGLWTEVGFGIFPDSPLGRNGHNGDFDLDGATNFVEYLHWLFAPIPPPPPMPAYKNPSLPDADVDLDGLGDAWEIAYFGGLGQGAGGDPDLDLLTNLAEFLQGTAPNLWNPDLDADGMSDWYENIVGTNPVVADGGADPDGDGFTNAQEWAAGSHPTKFTADWDRDWICDPWEAANGLSVLVDSRNLDPDGDTFINWVEYVHGYNPLVADADVDADGLADAWEFLYAGGLAVMAAGGNLDGDGVAAPPFNVPCAVPPGAPWWPVPGLPPAAGFTNLQEFQTSSHPGSPDADWNLVNPGPPAPCYNTMPDIWEKKYSTITGFLQWGVNTDGDAVLNEAEYIAGTNPDDFFN